ncbi:LysM peptidoglycan-binding domain-containing protein [Nonomuraea sp. NPDC000554]|uniref:LysM peptidoglycan-binding domain-containing protein n=1 Tax=Nonomuraea sp. NPDC000554 TaxID=3154259 RepID=UPI0033337ABE
MINNLHDLVMTVYRAHKAVGSEADQQKLELMAAACKKLAADLKTVGDDHIDPAVERGRSNWSGEASKHYDEMVSAYFDPRERKETIKNLGHVAEVLGLAREASRQTQHAYAELKKSLIETALLLAGMSVMAGPAGRIWARIKECQIVVKGGAVASSIMLRLGAFLQRVGVPLEKITEILAKGKRLSIFSPTKLASNLRLGTVNAEGIAVPLTGMSDGKMAWTAFKGMTKLFGINLAGNFMYVGLGRLMKGQSFIAPFGLGYAEMVNTSAISMAFPYGSLGFKKLYQKYGLWAYFGAGASTGMTSTYVNDRLENKSAGQTAWDMFKVGLLNGGWNAGTKGFLNWINLKGRFPNLKDNQIDQIQQGVSSFGAIAPGTLVRNAPPPIGVPYKTPPDPVQIDVSAPPSHNIPPDRLFGHDPGPSVVLQAPSQVGAGETLASIAQRVYGDESRWREIYNVNRDLIGPNPDDLKPGMSLKIPK